MRALTHHIRFRPDYLAASQRFFDWCEVPLGKGAARAGLEVALEPSGR